MANNLRFQVVEEAFKKTEQVNDIKERIDDDLSQLKDVAEKSSLEYYYK